jgi:filamentous hemagglutinin
MLAAPGSAGAATDSNLEYDGYTFSYDGVAVDPSAFAEPQPTNGFSPGSISSVGHASRDSGHIYHSLASFVAPRVADDLVGGLARPSVSDPKLNQLLDEIYRPGAQIGSGSTADAVRYELQTGLQVGGRSHIQKADDMSRALENWMRRNPDALATDHAAAQSVIDDMRSALDGR